MLFYGGSASIGLLTIRPAASLTLSDLLFLAALVAAVVQVAKSELDARGRLPRAVVIGACVFGIGGAISSFGAVVPMASFEVVIRVLYLMLAWFWLSTIVLRTRAHVALATMCWVASAALSGAGALIQLRWGPVIPGGEIAWGRMTGFTEAFNNLGGVAATALVPALMFAVDGTDRRQRMLGVAVLPFILSGLLLSGSVGGLLAASLALALWIVVRGVSVRSGFILGSIAVAGMVALSLSGSLEVESPFDRLSKVTSSELPENQGGTLYSRVDVYGTAWTRIRDQPLIGAGLDEESMAHELRSDVAVHNLLLNQWFTAGVLGIAGVAFAIGSVLLTGVRVVRDAHGSRALELALLSAFFGFVCFAMGEPILFVRYGWFPGAMLLVLRAQAAVVAAAPAPRVQPVRLVPSGRVVSSGLD